jgi:hypothetical protein
MDTETWRVLGPSLIIAIPGIYALYLQFKKQRYDEAKTGGEALTIYMTKCDELAQENKLLSDRQTETERKINSLETLVDDLRDWAERLCHQVISLGGTPVKMRQRSTDKSGGWLAEKLAVEFNAELWKIASRVDNTYDVTLKVPEQCLPMVQIMMGWLRDEVEIVMVDKTKATN